MTVKELIEELKKHPEDIAVFMTDELNSILTVEIVEETMPNKKPRKFVQLTGY